MAVDRWSWLGDHPAIDLANTVRRRGMQYVDLLATPDDLAEWLDHEADRLPRPETVGNDLFGPFLELRDATLELMRAAAAERRLPARSRHKLNEFALRYPVVLTLAAAVGTRTYRVLEADDDAARLLAELTAVTIDLLSSPDLERPALCDAPGCGQLYRRGRPNQEWCNPHCGARARSERHYLRTQGRAQG
jgi:predicted RNA-binding Zn ribbon-like protein